MSRKVTLEQVKSVLRARVCQQCPLRQPGQQGDRVDTSQPLGCEPACELFAHLPKLAAVASQIDPMLQSYDARLGHAVSSIIASIREARGEGNGDGRSSPLNRHRRCVIRTLTELVDQRPAPVARAVRRGTRDETASGGRAAS
jgi:hypothetical protein